MPKSRLFRFAMTGLGNTLIGLLVIFACKGFLKIGDLGANFIGYGIGILLGFLINSRWTFGHVGATGPAFARYLAVLVIAYVLNLSAVMYAIDVMALNSYLAQAAGIAPYSVIGYVGSRYFVFTSVKAKK